MAISKLQKGDTGRTALHASVINEIIEAVNRVDDITVLPEGKCTVTVGKDSITFDFGESLDGGGALGPVALTVCHLGAPGYRDFNAGPPRATPTA